MYLACEKISGKNESRHLSAVKANYVL